MIGFSTIDIVQENDAGARLAARVEIMVREGTAALKGGDLEKGLAAIDRAWRHSPDNFLIAKLLGQILVAADRSAAALHHFEAMQARWPLPDIAAGIIDSLLKLGKPEEALLRVAQATARFAVAAGGALAQACDQALLALPQESAAYLAFSPALELIGSVTTPRAAAPALFIDDRFLGKPDRAPVEGIRSFCRALPRGTGAAIVSLRIGDAESACLASLAFPPPFILDGRTTLVKGRVQGWASMAWLPDLQPDLIVADDRGAQARLPCQQDPTLPFRWRFDVDPEALGLAGNAITVSARLPDATLQPLPDAPLLRSVPAPPPGRSRSRRHATRGDRERPVDIIVPAYRGRAETIECLGSLIETASAGSEVIVIDDASPDPLLTADLEALAARGAITLLRNEQNSGFPATCNRGMALHGDRDVVLLNADTVVHGDWLTRLRRAAYSARNVGTVTPFGNAGSIASYPAGMEGDCDGSTARALDALARTVNQRVALEVPVGVGFCLYVRRDCLDEVGALDADTFAAGYGEEVDFCLRASERGWRHLLAADVFVRHAGSISFGGRRAALLERSKRLIDLRYPFFQELVDNFHANQPLAPLRRRLDEARLEATERKIVLLLTLALGGGVERFVAARCKGLEAQGFAPVVLKPTSGDPGICVLETADGRANDLRYRLPAELPALRRFLSRLDLGSIEFHHFLGLDAALIDEILAGPVPVDVYIHDYIWVCPRITLIDQTHRYCGEPDLRSCERCVGENGAQLDEPITVEALRARSARWLGRARHVYVSTQDAARRLRRYFPKVRTTAIAWEAPPAKLLMSADQPGRDRVRVALIGAIGVHKGYEILLACARDAAVRRLPIDFVVLGYTENDEELLDMGNVFVSGHYEEAELPELLDRQRPDLVFLPSVWPEIWCYALTPALSAGLPVVAFDLGAPKERLSNYDRGVLLPLTDDPVTLNNILLEVARENLEPASVSRGVGAATALASTECASDGSNPLRSFSMPALNTVTATVQILPVSDGLYAFSVREGAPDRAPALDNLLLPAVHVGLGPGVSSEHVEFIAGPTTHGAWLCHPGDIVVAKITGSVTILLTSLQSSTGQALGIEVEKLDDRKATSRVAETGAPAPAMAAPPVWAPSAQAVDQSAEGDAVPLEVRLHIRNQGDTSFIDTEWAGRVGLGKWIEAFSLAPRAKLRPADIEYKGLTATGLETPWLGGGAECGTRGKAIPLIGFAVRLRSGDQTAQFDCEYTGYFSSGTVIGPLQNGAPCRSSLKNDTLEGIQVRITERAERPRMAAVAPPPRVAIGPRFSKLREETGVADAGERKVVRPARRSAPARELEGPAPHDAAARKNGVDEPIFDMPAPPRPKAARSVRPLAPGQGPRLAGAARPGVGGGRKE